MVFLLKKTFEEAKDKKNKKGVTIRKSKLYHNHTAYGCSNVAKLYEK